MRFDFTNKKVTVMGLGRSGRAAALLCKQLGAEVTVSEQKPAPELGETDLTALQSAGIHLELGGHVAETFWESDYLVISPGVPTDHPLLEQSRQAGVTVLGEVELAFQYSPYPMLAVTGSNGKSTTTALLGEMLLQAGKNAIVGGNIGRPLVECIQEVKNGGLIVAEISSFQLETIHSFRPRVAALLNVTPDHLDRYRSMAEYIEAKAAIFKYQGPEDMAVINADDPLCMKLSRDIAAQKFYFSMKPLSLPGIYWEKGTALTAPGGEKIFEEQDLQIKGSHNIENALAAAMCALLAGAPSAAIRKALQNFKGLPHRIELVADIDGVKYINDSKGTNVGAAVKSIEGFSEPVILIAGGKDKGGDYAPLVSAIKKKVKHLILIGQARNKIRQALNSYSAVEEAASLEEAVELARQQAVKGDLVLLSPACSSFDMFRNYEERGEVFRNAVNKLRVES